MALIKCPECGKEISDKSPACIHCGFHLEAAEPKENVNSIVALFEAYAANSSSVGDVSNIFSNVMQEVYNIKQSHSEQEAVDLIATSIIDGLILIPNKATAQTDTVTVISEAVSDEPEIFVTPITEIFNGFEEVHTFYATKGGVKDESIPVSFKVENISDVTSNYNTYLKKITYTDNGNGTVTLLVDGSVMLGKTFDFVAYNEELGIENRQTIKVLSFF